MEQKNYNDINPVFSPVKAMYLQVERREVDGKELLNSTQWTYIADLENLHLYFTTYENHNWLKIDMKSLNLLTKHLTKWRQLT